MAALAQAEEQRQQDGAEQQPRADRHIDDQRARRGANHEPDGDRQDVENHQLLDGARVDELQGDVGECRDAEGGREGERGHEPDDHDPAGCCEGGLRGQRSGGDRPARLEGMLPIAVAIDDVVDEIDGARQAAEDRERSDCALDRRRVSELQAEEQPGEEHQVLRPLLGPQRA